MATKGLFEHFHWPILCVGFSSVYGLPTKSRISLLTPEEGNQELYTSETENPLKEVWMSLGPFGTEEGERKEEGKESRAKDKR